MISKSHPSLAYLSSEYKFFGKLIKIARWFWPNLEKLSSENQIRGIGEIITILIVAPLSLIGIIWLINITNWIIFKQNVIAIGITAILMIIFERLRFYLIIEIRASRYGSSDGSIAGIALWSAIFLFGPSALWLAVLSTVISTTISLIRPSSTYARLNQLRNFVMNLASATLVTLLALSLYQAIGGSYPLLGMKFQTIVIGLTTLLADFLLLTILWTGFLIYNTWVQRVLAGADRIRSFILFFFLAIGLPYLATPFAILATGLYMQHGLTTYIFFMVGMVLVALLARNLSRTAESSRLQSRILERLEQLSRKIISSPPDIDTLPDILQNHIPTMFPAGNIVIWTFPEEILCKHPDDWTPNLDPIWPWLLSEKESRVYTTKESLPWQENNSEHNPVVITPILEVESEDAIGGILLELHTLAQPWDHSSLNILSSATKSLAAQIASSYKQSEIYQQSLEYHRVSDELRLAGNIQSSLLPRSFPDLHGWQLAVTLDPAGETSGDFFDIIPLSDGKIGIVIADVMDKGIGPALYMTLSRTLIRTYATEFDVNPNVVLFATNERILNDTQANLFVSVFYGVLDLETGILQYSNAGHNPPYLLSSRDENDSQALMSTGLPIGLEMDATWEQESVQINPGDVLVLYTDGIPEAQNGNGDFFQEKKIVEISRANLLQPAEVVQQEILKAVHVFLGDTPQMDDITLMVLVRNL